LSRVAILTGLALAGLGCDAGVRGRTGLEELLRVNNATLVEGPLSPLADPSVTGGGLGVTVNQFHSLAFPGATNKVIAGSVQRPGRSVAMGLADDGAYWIVPAPAANQDIGGNDDLLFSASLSFAPAIPAGRHDLVLRAIDADGRMGPALIQPVMISDFAGVTGVLQVRLSWNTNADLDLHVVAPVKPPVPSDPKVPATIEVWVNQPSSLPQRPAFDPYSPEDLANGGLLDYDSNGACVIDGRRQENVTWGGPPPSGDYLVRVDTVSLCGEIAAQWQIDVFEGGNPIPVAAAFGESIDSDTRFSHRPGSGVLALGFNIP
jgi:hypothetical protein